MKRETLLRKLRKMAACEEAVSWLKASDHATLQAAWDGCERPDWMLWFLRNMGADKKLVVELACDCAATALPIYAKRYPNDDRPASAIRTARAWANGMATIEEVRADADAAYAAAYADAAYAAAYAAAADRLKANRKMAALIRKRVPDPEALP